MGFLQELRIRLVIALRQIGFIPTYQWLKLELDRSGRKKSFKPEPIAEGAHVLVVCAYYEHPEWVRDMVASIQAQTFKEWTLVIMDDCSPNHPIGEALSGIDLSHRIIMLKAEQNQGAYACRNAAIAEANKRDLPWTHVTFIDPDDIAYPDWLEHGLECIGSRQGVVRVILERWDERLRKMKRRALSHAQSLWTKEVWIQLGGFAEVRVAGDTELLLRAKYASPAVNVFKGIKPAQKCRIHSGNASQTSLIERKKWLLQRESKLQLSRGILGKKRAGQR